MGAVQQAMLTFYDFSTPSLPNEASPASYANVVFNCDWENTDGATAATDNSTYGRALTFSAGAEIDTAQFLYGTSSLKLNGTTGIVTSPDAAELTLGTQPWTMQTAVRFASVAGFQAFMGQWGVATPTNIHSWSWYWSQSTSGMYIAANNTLPSGAVWAPVINTWYRIMVVRSGAFVYFFSEGIYLGSVNISAGAIADSITLLSFGANVNGSYVNGHMDATRIIIGEALHVPGGASIGQQVFIPRNSAFPTS
jgi:hypothetical protein